MAFLQLADPSAPVLDHMRPRDGVLTGKQDRRWATVLSLLFCKALRLFITNKVSFKETRCVMLRQAAYFGGVALKVDFRV